MKETKRSTRTVGALGEDLGERFLKQRGYQIIARNVRSPFGEIDAVAFHQRTLVFIEIKTRSSQSFGLPEEALTHDKRKRLIRLDSWYLTRPRQPLWDIRFDVLAVDMSGDIPQFRLLENAFELEKS